MVQEGEIGRGAGATDDPDLRERPVIVAGMTRQDAIDAVAGNVRGVDIQRDGRHRIRLVTLIERRDPVEPEGDTAVDPSSII